MPKQTPCTHVYALCLWRNEGIHLLLGEVVSVGFGKVLGVGHANQRFPELVKILLLDGECQGQFSGGVGASFLVPPTTQWPRSKS